MSQSLSWKTSKITLIAGLLLLLLSLACRRHPVALVEYQDVAIASGSGKVLSLEDVGRAIAIAAAEGKANWQLSNVELGKATATLKYRNDVVVIQIVYTENTLSMVSGDGKTEVRPKYNQLIAAFLKAIQRELART